jgi:hypothetical protein
MTITTFIGVVYLICGGVMVFNATFKKIFQLYHGYLVLLVEYTEKTADLPQV